MVPPVPLPVARPAGILGPSVLIPVYLLLIFGGYFVFHSGRATIQGNDLSRYRSLLAATNAATLTGFVDHTPVSEYTPIGKATAFGLMLAGIWFSLIAGATAIARIAHLDYSDWKIARWALGSTVAAALLGATAGWNGSLFDSIFQSVSAFGNCGLFSTPRLPDPNSMPTQILILPLAILGGIGLTVLMEAFDWLRGKAAMSPHGRATILWLAVVYLIGAALLFFLQMPHTGSSPQIWIAAISTASRDSINSRTAGFPFQFASSWPRTVQWATIALMLIGAGSGGTAGGLKVGTLAVIFLGIHQTLAARSPGRAFGIALVWIAEYLLILLVALLLLLSSEPQMSADQILFLAASALGNVGLSHNPLALSDSGLYVLSATMLAGRITPVLTLWWMAETTPADSQIAVG